jgi:hypothetical protein
LGEPVVFSEPELTYIGEVSSSVRQLVKVMTPVGTINDAAIAVNADGWWLYSWIWRLMLPVTAFAGGTEPILAGTGNRNAHPLLYFRRGFAVLSGGLRVRAVAELTIMTAKEGATGATPVFDARYQPAPAGPFITVCEDNDKNLISTTATGFNSATGLSTCLTSWRTYRRYQPLVTQDLAKGALDFTIAHKGPCLGLCAKAIGQTNNDDGELTSGYRITVMGRTAAPDSGGVTFSMAAADDYNLSYYDGPPVCSFIDV